MEKLYDAAALGELLVDFTENGLSDRGNPVFEANPGGAPCNVLAMLGKLGRRTAFIGKVGRDFFGETLKSAAAGAGIDVSALRMDPEHRTTLAFVHTDESGERDFAFYRSPGADTMLSAGELPRDILRGCRIFHFGTLSMTRSPAREATEAAVLEARRAGALISFDPNLRPPLWPDLEAARERMHWGLAHCDILKIADNELDFLGCGVEELRSRCPDIRLFCLTMGAYGSRAYYEGLRIERPALALGGVVDTTGAGDTFCACMLDFVLRRGLDGLCGEEIAEALRFANAAAYLVTTKKGALLSMPEREDVLALL